MADQVYQISKTGSLSQCEVAAVGTTYNVIKEEVEVKVPADNIYVPQNKPATVDASEPPPRVADRTVYRTYFRAIGVRNLSIFVLFGLAFAFCIKFPGEYHYESKSERG